MPVLTPVITVVVHPVDTQAHPSVPPGWRWAVMVGGRPLADLGYCAHAGWAPTAGEAAFDGESCGAAACRAVRMFGVPADYGVLRLDHDPIPAGVEQVNVLG